jgi:Flp pilus assembly protein protease CpaA
MFEVFIIVLALIWMIFASIQDWKSKEIANWLNFSLIIFTFAFRFFYSLFNESFAYFYQGIIWFSIFFVIGNLLYYGKMFAGGDARLMYAMGVILPLSPLFSINLKIFSWFFICFFSLAFLYTMGASVYYTLKNRNKFKKKFAEFFNKYKFLIFISFFLGFLLIISSLFFYIGSILFFGIILMIFPLLYIYTKSVDDSSMVRKIPSERLVEGDWLYSDIGIGKKIIKSNWRGLNNKEISLLKRYKKYVRIRDGIAFVPIFLFSFIATIIIYFLII